MRTNHTVEYLNERVTYHNESLVKYPKYKSMIEIDLANAKEDLKEANSRCYCGEDETGAKAYVEDNVLYVEGKPSGWRFKLTGLWSGKTKEVVYDGGTNWTATIKFY